MIIPAVNTTGAFTFSAPFNTDEYQNKQLKVIGIRSLIEMYNNNDDPLSNFYLKYGMSEEDYSNDIKNEVPIIVFSTGGNKFYYIPANKIISMPTISGIKYGKRIIAINIGVVPEELKYDDIISDLKNVVMDSFGISPTIQVIDGSDVYYKTSDEHEAFMNAMSTHPKVRVYKSYKTKYQEEKQKAISIEEKYSQLEKFMLRTWTNNVFNVNRPTDEDLKRYTKKIVIEMMAKSKTLRVGLKDFKLYLYNAFNKNPLEIYAKGFTSSDANGYGYYGVICNKEFEMKITDGTIVAQNLPYIFSSANHVAFEPYKGTIEILFSEKLNIRSYDITPCINSQVYCDRIRITMYNEDDEAISSITYTNERDFNRDGTFKNDNSCSSSELQLDPMLNVIPPLTEPTA